MAKKRAPKPRTNPESNVALSESDIAVIDALGILFNIAIGGRDAAGQQVAGAFDSRIEHWTRASKPKTAAIMGLMKQLATDPKMLAGRRQRAILRYAVPEAGPSGFSGVWVSRFGLLTSERLNARLTSLQLDVRCLDHFAPPINLVVHVSGRLFGRAAKYLR